MKKLFVLGPSVSCYYGKYLKKMLSGVMEYDRKGGTHTLKDLEDYTDGINGGDSSMVLTYLNEVINKDWFKPDILLLSCGGHDQKRNLKTNQFQVSPEDYEKNLNIILSIVKKQNISPVWAPCTPLNKAALAPPPGVEVWRFPEDRDRYNAIADRIMAENSVPVIDLAGFTEKLGNQEIYINNGKDLNHFTEEASALQAAFIAGWLLNFISK